MNDEINAAADTLAKAKMARYNHPLDFITDSKNAADMEAWMRRLGGGWDRNLEVIIALKKLNMVADVARLMWLSAHVGPQSLPNSLSSDIYNQYKLDEVTS